MSSELGAAAAGGARGGYVRRSMAIISDDDTSRMVINTINGSFVFINMPPPPVDVNANADAGINANVDAVSKLVQLALGGIGVGTFSVGSAGAAYRDQLLAGAHGRAYEVAFFVSLAVVYLVSVGEMLAAARWVSLDGATAKKITFISLLLLMVLVVFGLVSYYLLNNH